jgi:hypothetical protein
MVSAKTTPQSTKTRSRAARVAGMGWRKPVSKSTMVLLLTPAISDRVSRVSESPPLAILHCSPVSTLSTYIASLAQLIYIALNLSTSPKYLWQILGKETNFEGYFLIETKQISAKGRAFA